MSTARWTGERRREATRREPTESSVFIGSLSGMNDEAPRTVIRHDVHVRALEAARKVIRGYYVERQRQI